MKEYCDCKTCSTHDDPCEMDCVDPDLCQGCYDEMMAEEDARFEIGYLQGRR